MSHDDHATGKSGRAKRKGPLTVLGMLPVAEGRPPSWSVRGFVGQFFGQFWRYFVTGVMVWVPLIITLWLTWLVIDRLGFGVDNLIKDLIAVLNRLGERVRILGFLTYLSYRPGFGFLFILVVFLTTGLVTRYLIARKVIRFGERILERIPLISTIYRAVQQIRDVFISREGTVFQSVCLIEYPRPGSHVVAFVTSREEGIVQEAMGIKLVAVFVPTTPNPTSGFLLYVRPESVQKLDITVEDAMKLIISGGAYLPQKKEP